MSPEKIPTPPPPQTFNRNVTWQSLSIEEGELLHLYRAMDANERAALLIWLMEKKDRA